MNNLYGGYLISHDELVELYRRWEQDYRDGKTISHEESAAMTVEEVAQNGATAFLHYLGEVRKS